MIIRILLDECLPKKLKYRIEELDSNFFTKTTPQMGWASLSNGKLLSAAEKEFDVFITSDKNLSFQQSISSSSIQVVLLKAKTNTYEDLPEPYYTVLWENENIRIVEHRMEIGESEPRHSHPKMLAYIMENSNVRVTEADGTVHDVSLTKGEFQELSPWTHSIENIGETPLHTLLVELKTAE